MSNPIETLADLLAPVTPETFFSEYRFKKPLHIKGDPEKFARVMNWQILTGLVNQTSIWSSKSLLLVLDHQPVDPKEYCVPEIGRDKTQLLMPDPAKVKAWLRRGASMVCNDIDQLTPELRAVASALETSLNAKVQANLYCSWKAHPAFRTHFDTHEVFAVHVAGRKTWKLYGRSIDDPIAHPYFKSLPQEYHNTHRGPLTQEVTLEPGDLLYLPRGWYHDALATSEATVHIAFGATGVIGLDVLTQLFDRAVQDPLFRKNLPSDRKELAEHLAQLGDRFAEFCRTPEVVDRFAQFIAGFRFNRETVTLPDDALSKEYRRAGNGIRLARKGSTFVLTDGKQGVAVPPGTERPIQWMLDREGFGEPDFAAAFPEIPEAQRTKLLGDLVAMDVIRVV